MRTMIYFIISIPVTFIALFISAELIPEIPKMFIQNYSLWFWEMGFLGKFIFHFFLGSISGALLGEAISFFFNLSQSKTLAIILSIICSIYIGLMIYFYAQEARSMHFAQGNTSMIAWYAFQKIIILLCSWSWVQENE